MDDPILCFHTGSLFVNIFNTGNSTARMIRYFLTGFYCGMSEIDVIMAVGLQSQLLHILIDLTWDGDICP